MKRLTYIIALLSLTLQVSAATWTTHFAYNSVDHIAAGGGVVYCVSSGSLFSVDVQSEKIRTYSNQDGMHGTDIACICWLEPVQSLMIMYANGKMDLLSNGQFHYIPDLYNKYTTFSKLCHSVIVKDSLAFMAMDYGIQTFHIRKREFVDTYLIGPEATEVPVYSIALSKQTIYAAGDSTLYAASFADNIVDYSYWAEIPLPFNGHIQQIAQASGQLYMLIDNTLYRRRGEQWQKVDNNSYSALNVVDGKIYPATYPTVSYSGLWMAAGANGVIRQMESGETVTYQMNGPLNNKPYRLTYQQDQLFMLNGGRWAVQSNNPGCVMRYDGSSWHNITQKEILNAAGGSICIDFMNVAVDPNNSAHYFVTSYGSGLYEFLNDKCIKRWNTDNSILGSAAVENPARYTRTDGAIYDAQGNLWVMNTGNIEYNIVIFTADNKQIGMNVNQTDGSRFIINTAGQFIFDNCHPNYVWALVPRGNETEAGLALIDTKGTIDKTDDDRSLIRIRWTDQDGNSLTRSAIYAMRQDKQGNIWLATNKGILIIPASEDYFSSDRCQVVHLTNSDYLPIFDEERINDIVFDHLDRPWIATQTAGVYVLSPDAASVVEHFTMENSAMPSNTIMSLAYDRAHKRMYVGSALGLVAYTDPTMDINAQEQDYSEPVDYGSMMQWTTHFAYTDIDDIQLTPSHVYALSEGSLCAIDKDDESLTYYSKLNGLNGSSIHSIHYDTHTGTLVIAYDDGMIDLLDDKGNIRSVADLYLKQLNTSKQVQNLAFHDGKAYMAMAFGIVVMNIRKQEISDTYYIGNLGAELSVNAVTVIGDSIFAAADNKLYRACLKDNLVDYAKWQSQSLSADITHLDHLDGSLYMLMDSVIYRDIQPVVSTDKFVNLSICQGNIIAQTADNRVFEINASTPTEQPALAQYKPHCTIKEGNTWWLGTNDGVLHISADNSVQKYQPDGPSSNMPFDMTTYGSRLWVVPGGRWATEYKRTAQVMYYNGSRWDNLTYDAICRRMGATLSLTDIVHVAVDPADPEHFYAATYGTGVVEFLPDGSAKRYTYNNSPLSSATTGSNQYRYCRVDALTFDADRNLWLTNMSDLATNVHIIDPDHNWHSFNLYNGGQRIVLNTVSKFLIDNRDANYKWIACARDQAGLVLINDNGTPYNNYDDRVIFRSTFVDQDSKSITLARLGTIAQDHNGDMWLGTGEGILVIDANTDLFRSNTCRRLKMSRHDGTSLADYLLGTEQINSIVFAGGNRIWIGTDASGVYLIHMVTKEGIYEPEILAHFTTLNSPMPSDCVLSIAIDEKGEVYIGTAKGLVSYRGDATEPEQTFADAYVYPNPVRPNYEGVITVSGLMDNTTIYIADAAGNVVCRTHSNGGTAVWDGKTKSGKKAHSGVYTIYCNTADGRNYTTLKVLIIH